MTGISRTSCACGQKLTACVKSCGIRPAVTGVISAIAHAALVAVVDADDGDAGRHEACIASSAVIPSSEAP